MVAQCPEAYQQVGKDREGAFYTVDAKYVRFGKPYPQARKEALRKQIVSINDGRIIAGRGADDGTEEA